MRVRKFDLKFDPKQVGEFMQMAKDILTAPRPISNGHYVKLFEEAFADLIGSKYATAVMNGTGALEVTGRALKLAYEHIIIPTNTFISTALTMDGLPAHFLPIDIEDETFALSPERLQDALEKEDIHAVILVHIAGQISKYVEEIIKLCRDYEVVLIEDASQAHFAEYKYRAGTFGEVGTFSFASTKVMTTGEGGMIVTDNEELDAHMKQIRNYGAPPGDAQIHTLIGGNYKMTEFQAILGLLELKRVKNRIVRRKSLSDIYIERLRHNPAFRPAELYGASSHYKQIVQFDGDVIELKEYCKNRGVDLTGEVYYNPIHAQPIYAGRFDPEEYPVANRFCKHHICPPNYPELTTQQVVTVCEVLNSFTETHLIDFPVDQGG